VYRRDLQCVAEMTYLMLQGQPVCKLTDSTEELAKRFQRGTVCFGDTVHAKTSENAKAFVLDLLRPTSYKKASRIQACHEVAIHMSHRWFRPETDSVQQLTELYDMILLRRYDTWRTTLRLRTNFMKILADHMSLPRIRELWERLSILANNSDRVSWATMVPEILRHCPILHLLQKVNKAFGENEEMRVIHIKDTQKMMEAWRRKRVREILWQVFNRAKAFTGIMTAEACTDGLNSKVLHVWSRPMRVLDIVLPSDSPESTLAARRVDELVGHVKMVSFLDLVAKTDAAEPP